MHDGVRRRARGGARDRRRRRRGRAAGRGRDSGLCGRAAAPRSGCTARTRLPRRRVRRAMVRPAGSPQAARMFCLDAARGGRRTGGGTRWLAATVMAAAWQRAWTRSRRRCRAGVVAGAAQQIQDGGEAGEGVEADGVADLAAGAGIVRQHDGDAAVRLRRGREPGPAGGAVGGQRDPVWVRAVHGAGVFEAGDRSCFGFERDRGGEQPAVQLGQHDVHREVGGRQAARRRWPSSRASTRPARVAAPGHRRRRAARARRPGGGKGGGVEHDCGRQSRRRSAMKAAQAGSFRLAA